MNSQLSPDDISDGHDRLHNELELLKAMYQDSVTFNPTTAELKFISAERTGAQLVLRLPDGYPTCGKPQVVSACDESKRDLRTEVVALITELGGDEEVLDTVIHGFNEMVEDCKDDVRNSNGEKEPQPQASKTVIIWLHHLLATSKRKLALHPSSPSRFMSGITKPGYPGVMAYTGPKAAVDEHIAELKALNWQAFQVRYEEDIAWDLNDGGPSAIVEVETMAEVVQHIEEGRKEDFLKAVGVK